MLLITLPFAVLVTGFVTLARNWRDDMELPQAALQTFAAIRTDRTTLVVAVVRAKLVSLAASGTNQRLLSWHIDLAAKALDVDVDDVRQRVVMFVPDVLGDIGPAHDQSGVMSEVFEQRVLPGGERDPAMVS